MSARGATVGQQLTAYLTKNVLAPRREADTLSLLLLCGLLRGMPRRDIYLYL